MSNSVQLDLNSIELQLTLDPMRLHASRKEEKKKKTILALCFGCSCRKSKWGSIRHFFLPLYYYFFFKEYSYTYWLAHISTSRTAGSYILRYTYTLCLYSKKIWTESELQGFFADCSTLWAWAWAMAAAHSLVPGNSLNHIVCLDVCCTRSSTLL